MQRFFLHSENIQAGIVRFPAAAARQIEQVLRMNLLESQVIVLDNSGMEYLVRLAGKDGKILLGEVIEEHIRQAEPLLKLILGFSLSKREKVEWILQKGTEIGISSFQPFISERSLDRSAQFEDAKRSRWETIIREAAEQSGRSKLPELQNAISFQKLILTGYEDCIRMIAWEESDSSRLLGQQHLTTQDGKVASKVLLLIGPEGGFSAEEVTQAEARGFVQISLGPRILRMETACIVASVILLHMAETNQNTR